MSRLPLPPGAWLGLLGGGQLGRMFSMAAQSLGYRVAVLDPAVDSPAAAVADLHVRAGYADPVGLKEMAGLCDAVTTEFENVPADSLRELGRHGFVSPAADSVAVAQDRIREKRFIAGCGIPVAPHAVLQREQDFEQLPEHLFPAILKVSRLGYDGKGQVRVADPDAAREAYAGLGQVPCVLEKRLDLDFEISVVVARALDGSVAVYPIAENIHRDGILAVSTVPSRKASAEQARSAAESAQRIAAELNYVGVLCVEFFVLRDGSLIVNEMAPRPHNSGHYSIDACVTSQFEQQARVLAGLPLGRTRQHSYAVMLNLLGDLWFPDDSGTPREPDWASVLELDGAKLHLYGKHDARIGRKMGHLTVVAESPAAADAVAFEAARRLGLPSW